MVRVIVVVIFSFVAISYIISIILKHNSPSYKYEASLFNMYITSHFNILCPIIPNGVLQIDQIHIFLATSVLSSQVTISLFSEVLFSCCLLTDRAFILMVQCTVKVYSVMQVRFIVCLFE